MRESSFAFPGQNKACVCISSQLYDRRALDTPSALPLFNSLTHLVYLTSTSPRIREIMTMDGGLERLVRILHSFVLSPPLPESSSLIFGLSPPASTTRHSQLNKDLIPSHYDKAAAHRFSLAFQCLVNIGVRGSEPIRSRVVQAGTLDVVGCILEAWLMQRGFNNPVTSLSSASSRSQPTRVSESREQRHARRAAARAHVDGPAATTTRSIPPEEIARFWAYANATPPHQQHRVRNPIPLISIPPASAIALSRANNQPTAGNTEQYVSRVSMSNTLRPRSSTIRASQPSAPASSPSPPPMESATPSPAPNSEDSDSSIQIPNQDREEDTTTDDEVPRPRHRRRTGTLVPSAAHPVPAPPSGADAHIIISNGGDSDSVGMVGGGGLGDVDPVGIGAAGGVTGGAVSIGIPTQNDDLAMGAPPGAPGALPITRPSTSRLASHNAEEYSETESDRDRDIPDIGRTPNARLSSERMSLTDRPWSETHIPGAGPSTGPHQPIASSSAAAVSDTELPSSSHHHHSHYGPHREAEDVQIDRDRMEVEETPRAGSIALPGSLEDREGTIRQSHSSVASTSTTNQRAIPPTAALQTYLDAHQFNHTPHQVSNPASPISIFRGPTAAARTASTATIRANPTGGVPQRAAVVTAPLRPPRPATITQTTGQSVASGPLGGGLIEKEKDGPYRDDDVLLSLQLLAYLSKYPHVRQAFYVRRAGFHPATVLQNLSNAQETLKQSNKGKEKEKDGTMPSGSSSAPATNGKEKSFLRTLAATTSSAVAPMKGNSDKDKKNQTPGQTPPPGVPRETNVFALVERFTFRPPGGLSNRTEPRIPAEIQYWAGVIMRNACRKDESKGGVRQCANMLCGKWESYPREFAKCRRCRKAKYCGKECQSLAWSEGHRFWCSARNEAGGEDGTGATVVPGSGGQDDAEGQRERRALAALGFLGGVIPPANATNTTITPGSPGDFGVDPSPTGTVAPMDTIITGVGVQVDVGTIGTTTGRRRRAPLPSPPDGEDDMVLG